MENLRLIFHVIAVAHHWFATINSMLYFDFSKTTDPEVLKIDVYRYRFLTTWNFIFQTTYFTIALNHDLINKTGFFKHFDKHLMFFNGYIFTTLMFSTTLFVTVMFWVVFNINREWVLPAASDLIMPQWFNHSIHSIILVFLITELVLTDNNFIPSFKSAFIGLTVFSIAYDFVLFKTYFESGIWLYSLFYVFTWNEKIIFVLVNYFINVVLMKMGILLQTTKINPKKPVFLLKNK